VLEECLTLPLGFPLAVLFLSSPSPSLTSLPEAVISEGLFEYSMPPHVWFIRACSALNINCLLFFYFLGIKYIVAIGHVVVKSCEMQLHYSRVK
jgi:hypothetical protein